MNENIKWDASNPVRFTHIVFDGEIHKLDNMIKANELRIGNWVLAEGNPYKIKHISPDDEWEPIPLTFEILEKAGFEKFKRKNEIERWEIEHEGHFYHLQIREHLGKELPMCGCMGVFTYKDEVPIIIEGKETWYDMGETLLNFAWHIKYVHELQNLYFALTGTELEINLT